MNSEFENYLNQQKDEFCKFYCEYYKLNNIDCADYEFECEDCGGENIIYPLINLCEFCKIDKYIKYVRDGWKK